MRLALIALVLAQMLVAASYRPSPRPAIRRNYQQANPQKPDQEPRSDQRGSDTVPLVVKVIRTPSDQETLDREAREREEKAALDRKLVVWTTILGIATVVLAAGSVASLFILLRQGGDLRKQQDILTEQTAHLEAQATALRATLDQMKDTARRQLRTYLTGESSTIRAEYVGKSLHVAWEIGVINSGQTPAYGVGFEGGVGIGARPMELDDLPKAISNAGPLTIGAGQRVFFKRSIFIPESEVVPVVHKWTRGLYFYGTGRYKDAFGEDHRMEFCLRATWHEGKPTGAVPAEHYNTAD